MPDKSIEIINYNGTEYEVGIQSLATSEKKGLMSPEDKDKLENMLVSSVSGNDPISVSNTNGTATISHNDSGVTANTYGVTAATGLTPEFGGTFSVPGFTVNAKGHVTAAGAHNVTIPATLVDGTNPGLMSVRDKSRLDNMADNATNTTIEATSPIIANAETGEVTISHATSGPSSTASTSKGDTSDQAPLFGGTFKVTSGTVDKYGHTTAFAEHTVTIPATLAASDKNGLMSKTDKANFDAGIGIAGNTIAIGGSLDASTLRTSLGLSNAMHFIGIATVAITDGSTTNPSISGYTFGTNGASAQKGDVVIDKDSAYEFVWTGSKWERLGPDGSYALVDHTHATATSGAAGFMSATDKQKLDGIAENANNYSLPTASTTTKGGVKVGTGLTMSGEVLNHSNAITAQTTQAVYPIKIDAQGHISAYGAAITSMAPTAHTHARTDIGLTTDAVAGNLDSVTRPMVGSAASNKSFNLPAAAIVVEYSTDGGSTWTDYGATDDQKRSLFTETRTTNFYLGKASVKANNTVNNQLRVTIEPTDRYTSFDAVYVWMSTKGNTVVMDLERSTIGAKNTFTSVFTGQSVNGWSGNNIRYFPQGQFGEGTSQTTNNYKYRLTFRQTAINSNYASAIIMDIRFYGLNVWTSPNNMVSKNHIYTWDNNLNTTFPAKVIATTFEGNLDWSYIQNKPTLGTLAEKSSIANHTVTTPTGATSRTTDVAVNTTTVNSITAVGTLPSLTITSTSVVTGGSTTDIPNITKKTVVTEASYANGILTLSTGDSVTVGTAIKAYTSLTTGSVGSASGWSAGTLPTKGSNTTVATGISTQPTFTVTTQSTTLSHSIS